MTCLKTGCLAPAFWIHISASLTLQESSFLLQYMVINTQTHNWSRLENKWEAMECSALNALCIFSPHALRLRGHCGRGGRKTARARGGGCPPGINAFVHDRGVTHMNSSDGMHETCTNLSQTKPQHGGRRWAWSPASTWGAIGNWQLSRKRKVSFFFFLRAWCLVGLTCFNGWPHTQEYIGCALWDLMV